jgi:HAD superfamily hydrolase (TIGR01490 family)
MNKIKTLALFDFDKTLTTKDSFVMFFVTYFLSPKRVLFVLLESMKALPLLSIEKITERIKLKIIQNCLGNMPTRQMDLLGTEFADKHLPKIMNVDLFAQLQNHQDRGDEVWIVSASLAPWLRPWCRTHKVKLLCTELETSENLLTGNISGYHCCGINKAKMVRENIDISQYQSIHVYGNMPADKDLLELGTTPLHRHTI